MKRIIYFVGIFIFLAVAIGMIFYNGSYEKRAKKLNVKIEKDKNGIWRVLDKNGNNKGTLKVKKMDRISWQVKHSKMVFTFSKNVNNYFEYDEGLFADGKSQTINANKKLDVTLKDTAPNDTLVYQIYVVDADTFVVGHSPPVIIIQR